MNNTMGRSILLLIIIALVSCNSTTERKENKFSEGDEAAIIKAVKSQVDAFLAADTTMNSEGVINLLWPEYTMLADGHYVTYQQVKTGSKAFMASLESFNTEWKDVRIVPLGSHHAISSFIFTDSLVAKDGTITQSKGPNTFVWEERDGEWKLIYGDADHYSIDKE